MYAVYVSILGGIFFRNNHNWTDGKLHSLKKIILSLSCPSKELYQPLYSLFVLLWVTLFEFVDVL